MVKDWEKRLKEAVERARKEEQERAKQEIDKIRHTHESQIEILEGKLKRMDADIKDLNLKIN